MKDQAQQTALPEEVVAELRRLDAAVTVMTPEVDRRLAAAAQAHFSARPAARTRAPRWALPAALAACFVAAAVTVHWLVDTAPRSVPAASLDSAVAISADDIDGSGQVDILDAFALARRQAAGRDNATQAQIDALVARIVAVAPEEGLL